MKQGESAKILGPDYDIWVDENGQVVVEPPFPPNADAIQKWEVEQKRRVRASAIKTLLRRQQEGLDELTHLELNKEKKVTEEEQKELELLPAAADAYDQTNQDTSYELYLPLLNSKSGAVKAQAYVALSEMNFGSSQDDRKRTMEMRKKGLTFLKTYQDENPGSGPAAKVDGAIKKLMELGRLRREADKDGWDVV